MELIQNDKELQADLAYLVGTGRLRTSCSVYGSAVEDGKAEKIRSAINIEKWEMLEEQEDEDDNILEFPSQKQEVKTASFFAHLPEIP